VLIGFGVLLTVVGLAVLVRTLMFLDRAESTTGIVISAWSEPDYEHFSRVEFYVGDRVVWFVADHEGRVGAEVNVVYDPDSPASSARVKGHDLWRWTEILLGSGVAVTIGGVVLLWWERRKERLAGGVAEP
jgi:hypothetical protein